MKSSPFLMFFLFVSSSLLAQVPQTCVPSRCKEYQEARQLALSYAEKQDYKQALASFSAASLAASRFCNMNCDSLINREIDSVFAVIQGKFLEADSAKLLARQAEKQAKMENERNRRFISRMQFFDKRNRRFALAFNKDKYGFIDAQGQELIPFTYQQAKPFNEWGYAEVANEDYPPVRKAGKTTWLQKLEFLRFAIDTLGNRYRLPLAGKKSIGFFTELVELRNEEKWPSELFRSKRLKVLLARGCKFPKLHKGLTEYKELEVLCLPSCAVEKLTEGFFTEQAKLRELNLASNRIQRLEAESLKGLHNLEILDLRDNELSYIDPKAFAHTPKLKRIYLQKNKLEELDPRVFEGLAKLELLDIQDNPLKDIPKDLIEKKPKIFYWAANQKLPEATVLALIRTETALLTEIEQAMRLVEAGFFLRACQPQRDSKADMPCNTNEGKAELVELDAFYISAFECTQKQWRLLMGQNRAEARCDNCPVEGVSWNEAMECIRRLNLLSKQEYDLPTEAQWEYAARGGNIQEQYMFAGSADADNVAWHKENSYGWTQPVGLKKANALGLYDMSGNASEWCKDWYAENYQKSGFKKNPQGPKQGEKKLIRGGNVYYPAASLLAAPTLPKIE